MTEHYGGETILNSYGFIMDLVQEGCYVSGVFTLVRSKGSSTEGEINNGWIEDNSFTYYITEVVWFVTSQTHVFNIKDENTMWSNIYYWDPATKKSNLIYRIVVTRAEESGE